MPGSRCFLKYWRKDYREFESDPRSVWRLSQTVGRTELCFA